MQGLGLCLWLVGAKSHPWTSIVQEVCESLQLEAWCRPHVRLQSRLKLGTLPEAPQVTLAKITGGLFTVTTHFPGWPPLQTIELPVSLDTHSDEDNEGNEDTHLSLAHRFGVEPFTLADVRKVEVVLAEHDDKEWRECVLHPLVANMALPDPSTWRDISP